MSKEVLIELIKKYREMLKRAQKLYRHYQETQDVEMKNYEQGKVYTLETIIDDLLKELFED